MCGREIRASVITLHAHYLGTQIVSLNKLGPTNTIMVVTACIAAEHGSLNHIRQVAPIWLYPWFPEQA